MSTDNIKLELREVELEGANWIYVAEDIDQLLACKSSPIKGLEWPRGFQEIKVPRFHDNGTGWW